MTPDLLARLQDDATVDAASEEWDAACAAYEDHFRAIQPGLPQAAGLVARGLHLHDAAVLAIAVNRKRTAVRIYLRLDEPGGRMIVLRYSGLRAFDLVDHPPLADSGKPLGSWLYSEFDVAEADGQWVATHAILFSGGKELRLSFRDLHVGRIEQFIDPARAVGSAGGIGLPAT
jgi:hypothetical protein